MPRLLLHDFHAAQGGLFAELNGEEIVASYGSVQAEYLALTQTAALLDLSFRGRICLLGADREKFLHGQVTNDVLRLKPGEGCYAALVTAKGKLETDLFVYKLTEELLLDFEPGLTAGILARLEKYIIAEDVQLADVAPHYGLLSIQGPNSAQILQSHFEIPARPLNWLKAQGDIYVTNNPRFGAPGYDLFVPTAEMPSVADRLKSSARWSGFEAAEIARIENGIPRFGVDMDGANLAPEAEIQNRAISYAKGCYIGQEVIARIRTYGQVAKALRLLRLPGDLKELPTRGAKLFRDHKEVGHITSSAHSPKHHANVALGYVRKEANAIGESLQLGSADGKTAQVIAIPGGWERDPSPVAAT